MVETKSLIEQELDVIPKVVKLEVLIGSYFLFMKGQSISQTLSNPHVFNI